MGYSSFNVLFPEWELLCFLERTFFIDLIIIVLDLPPRPNMKPSSVIQPCESPDCLTASSQCVIIIFQFLLLQTHKNILGMFLCVPFSVKISAYVNTTYMFGSRLFLVGAD